jgi:hypothetical protein
MARPKVDARLQNIEDGISDIKEKLCEIHPCKAAKQEPEAQTESEE